jgi:ammonia channel protein AmtB
LHRTASALIEAKKFNAPNALMLVHSFSKDNMWFDDYCKFLALFGVKGVVGSLVLGKNIDDVDLYFGWVKGDSKYLEV